MTPLSGRQIARLAKRLYGAPPKFLARKFRALRCAAQIAIDKRPWTELCENGFYDQSHFIREIKQFLGLTPMQLMADASTVARLTVQRRNMALAELNRIS
jgi:methylphosphotriester-DNA--protein-cysteine methyltransferase